MCATFIQCGCQTSEYNITQPFIFMTTQHNQKMMLCDNLHLRTTFFSTDVECLCKASSMPECICSCFTWHQPYTGYPLNNFFKCYLPWLFIWRQVQGITISQKKSGDWVLWLLLWKTHSKIQSWITKLPLAFCCNLQNYCSIMLAKVMAWQMALF